MKTKNPFNNKGASWDAWQSGYASMIDEENPYDPQCEELREKWEDGRNIRTKDDSFNKEHGLDSFSKKTVVDYNTNQPINEFTIGERAILIKMMKDEDDRDHNYNKYCYLLKKEQSPYIFYFKHYGRSFMIGTDYGVSSTDLIRVDFKNKKIIIEKDFFKDEDGE